MLVVAIKPGHDGNIAAVKDGELLFSVEGEKDSFHRYTDIQPDRALSLAAGLGAIPDVLAISGWIKPGPFRRRTVGGGYWGAELARQQPIELFGKRAIWFTDSHERSHILGAIGMAPKDDAPLRAVLVWEGAIGRFYLVDRELRIQRQIQAIDEPGTRYALLYALADPNFPDKGNFPPLEVAGKLMALAAFGDAKQASAGAADTLTGMLSKRPRKSEFLDSPLYNIGVEAPETKNAAALLTDRIFEAFADVALKEIPAGLPLHIGGGCGLNCEWNARWRDLGHFSSVFVPPCTNDSGSALGTAIDAFAAVQGDPHIRWSVYAGLEFDFDEQPPPERWESLPYSEAAVAEALDRGRIVAWVQGKSEIGPRALGNRSLLAEPGDPGTKERLNQIKQREAYRPIAPCCRVEDLPKAFVDDIEDPHMLFFNRTRSEDLQAVTHVDGTARVQTVSSATNRPLHDLLTAFAQRRGLGVLCNTSLNYKGYGFLNRMSDLEKYCLERRIDDMVVGDRWFRRIRNA